MKVDQNVRVDQGRWWRSKIAFVCIVLIYFHDLVCFHAAAIDRQDLGMRTCTAYCRFAFGVLKFKYLLIFVKQALVLYSRTWWWSWHKSDPSKMGIYLYILRFPMWCWHSPLLAHHVYRNFLWTFIESNRRMESAKSSRYRDPFRCSCPCTARRLSKNRTPFETTKKCP